MPSLLEALEQKYGQDTANDEDDEDEDEKFNISVAIFVPRKSARKCVPSLLVLNNCDIATAGEQRLLVDKCASVEELDLAMNKLKDWPEVFSILTQMPRLKFVNLSFNELSRPLVGPQPELTWSHLRNLVLNSTQIGWPSVNRLLDFLPILEELHLSFNNYNCVILASQTDAEKCHLSVKKLHFSGNLVDRWSEVAKIGHAFPNLESLVVADCPIPTLRIQDDDEEEEELNKRLPHDSFLKLKFLNLNSTLLSTWDEVERLSKFPALQRLRIQGCPIWETNEYTEHERRQLLIARLPNVEMLNGGGVIGGVEREDAERAFIRYYMDKAESERPDRYFDLVQVHGKLDPLVNVDLRPEKRVKVTFTCGQTSEVRSVDVYRTVFDLKTRLERFAGFPAAKMRLFYVDQDMRDIAGPEEMKYPSKQLYSYNIQSGDEIIIDCKQLRHSNSNTSSNGSNTSNNNNNNISKPS